MVDPPRSMPQQKQPDAVVRERRPIGAPRCGRARPRLEIPRCCAFWPPTPTLATLTRPDGHRDRGAAQPPGAAEGVRLLMPLASSADRSHAVNTRCPSALKCTSPGYSRAKSGGPSRSNAARTGSQASSVSMPPRPSTGRRRAVGPRARGGGRPSSLCPRACDRASAPAWRGRAAPPIVTQQTTQPNRTGSLTWGLGECRKTIVVV